MRKPPSPVCCTMLHEMYTVVLSSLFALICAARLVAICIAVLVPSQPSQAQAPDRPDFSGMYRSRPNMQDPASAMLFFMCALHHHTPRTDYASTDRQGMMYKERLTIRPIVARHIAAVVTGILSCHNVRQA